MNTIMTVLAVVCCAAAWRAVRARRRGERAAPGGRRTPALALVVAVLGLQLTLTAPASAQDSGCEVPNPERPGAGMVGAIDPPSANGEAGSAYLEHSYAGMVWHVYDCDNGALGLGSPESTIDTWAGNQLFNLGKNIVGATNSLHYTVLEGGLLNPIYNAVSEGAETVYDNIYTQLFGLFALLLAILLFRNIWRGDLATVSKRALFALGGVWLAASSMALLRYYDDIDNAIVQTTTNIQAGFVDESEDRVLRHVLPTDLHTEVVYKNWLRGEFGAPDSPEAEEHGRALLDAQSFTWEEMRAGDDADEALIEEKKSEFRAIANDLGPATGYFTGEDGSRTGTGFLAFIQSLCYALFQLFAKAAVLLAQILVRLFTLTAPLIGLVAILHHDILRRVGKVVGTVAFNLLVLSVLAGVQALLLRAIFTAGSSLSMLTQLVVAGLITVLLFMVGKPGKRLWQMVEMSVGMVGAAVPSPRGGLLSRFRRGGDQPSPQDEFWKTVAEDDRDEGGAATRGTGGVLSGGRNRPEATVTATAERLDTRSGAGAHPATVWAGGGGRAALPSAGSAESGVFGGYPPSRSPGDYLKQRDPMAAYSGGRRMTSPAVSEHGWDRADDVDPVVVPSRLASTGVSASAPSPASPQPAPERAAVPQPRRVEHEMVAGKPVFVLYRPSRGLEVRDDGRDTDRVVR
ncbi:magnesium transporter [Saccharomonospora piscinae]|uniref:magnesium transporter n=1 Tax=Saccharomonospora piscinae TaxID=687388 RepID=UPI001106B7F3|nr:magnesium transporter [Saccharomonospora piscinae]TLW89733.1 magnesium transporter [Saccharomonospora piscinae]